MFDPQKHHRRSIRLKGYDYAQAGAYFVTVVAFQRACLFGTIIDGEMQLNTVGKIVQVEWDGLPQRFRFVELGTSIIMPNHFHGIILFNHHAVGATRQNVTSTNSGNTPLPNNASASLDGSPLRPNGPLPALTGTPIWQRNYYEHIIRSAAEAERIHQYIESNLTCWDDDTENPHLAEQ